ncbi:MAG: ABC transporter substrate-binding protein [Silicimonas sp.]
MIQKQEATITRKEFLKFLAGGAVAVSALPGSVRRAMAQGADVLKMSFRSAHVRLDPAFTVSSEEYVVTQSIFDNLTRLDDALKPVPGLAKEWSSPDQGKTWLFKLREGVRFHDGRELSANDVVYSLKRVLDPENGSPGRRAIGPITSVSAEDSLTVKFELEGPFADFPAILSGTFARIIPEGAEEDTLNSAPMGTGPFKFVEWVRGQYVRVEANADYWMEGSPRVKEVVFATYPALAAEQAALSSGDVQMMWDVPLNLVPVVSKTPGVNLIEVPSTGFQPIVMRSDQPPFNDPRVRRAVKHAIDREKVMRFVLQGRGSIAQDTPVASSSAYYATDAKAPEHDVAKGRALMAEAGYEDGFDVKFFASNERSGCMETAQVVKPMLEAIGIRAQIQQVPWDRFNAEVWKKETLFVSNWVGRPTIDEQLYPYFHSTGSWNEYNYSNPEVDRLLDMARSELDPEKRRSQYAEVQKILAHDGPAIIAYFSNYASARAENVEGIPVSPLKWVDLRKAELT